MQCEEPYHEQSDDIQKASIKAMVISTHTHKKNLTSQLPREELH